MKYLGKELECGFCYLREQGTHGEIKREWSQEWMMYIAVCRKHSLFDGMDSALRSPEKEDEL